jgi:molybdopterin-guanine dinucleotide biosynthesis protein A
MVVMADVTREVTGYLLVGGESKKMGFDKVGLRIGETTLLERGIELLSSTPGKRPVVVGSDSRQLLVDGQRVLQDALPGCGPLGGLVTLPTDCSTKWALALAVDLPYLSRSELRLLLASPRAGLDVLTLTQSGELEPLAARYCTRNREFWEKRLMHCHLSLWSGIREQRWNVVFLPEGSSGLKNINSPQDLIETSAA